MGFVIGTSIFTGIIIIICGFLSYYDVEPWWVWIATVAATINIFVGVVTRFLMGSVIAVVVAAPGIFAFLMMPELDFTDEKEPVIESSIEENVGVARDDTQN